jgi:hypothetical protein
MIIIMSGQFHALAASPLGKELLMYIELEAVGQWIQLWSLDGSVTKWDILITEKII